ncbi:MAG: PEP-CTERM sorting domain-containing protein [Usitatibacteraceae bacterium]
MKNVRGKTFGGCLRSFFFGALVLAATTQTALATVILTNNRSDIEGPLSYTTNWGDQGGEFTSLGPTFTQGPVTVSGADGFTVFLGSTYSADFLADEFILALYDLNNGVELPGVFNINFATAVARAGAQVQALAFGGFTGIISAYDSSNALLGSFNVSGTTGGNGNGSAVFAGIVSDAANISRIQFAGFGAGAGINQLTANVPEPSSILLLIGPLVFLAVARRRRIRS